MPEAVRKYHERRDSADRVPVAGDSPEDYMSPIVRPLQSLSSWSWDLEWEEAHQGPNSIEKIWLEFWLEKPLEFWLEISYTKKMFKNA